MKCASVIFAAELTTEYAFGFYVLGLVRYRRLRKGESVLIVHPSL